MMAARPAYVTYQMSVDIYVGAPFLCGVHNFDPVLFDVVEAAFGFASEISFLLRPPVDVVARLFR